MPDFHSGDMVGSNPPTDTNFVELQRGVMFSILPIGGRGNVVSNLYKPRDILVKVLRNYIVIETRV